ncbi:MAG: cbb3-type cytochrome c oxidase subunit I, partial [Polyangiaceae bacterium]
VNKWTHGTLITAMHGHMAFFGAYVMIVLAMITFAMPGLTGRDEEKSSALGMWAFWLQVIGMLGMTMAFAAAGIVQTYLEHILSMGYLDTQHKLTVHFIMLMAAGSIFAVGVLCFLVDFFFLMVRAPSAAALPAPAQPIQVTEAGE